MKTWHTAVLFGLAVLAALALEGILLNVILSLTAILWIVTAQGLVSTFITARLYKGNHCGLLVFLVLNLGIAVFGLHQDAFAAYSFRLFFAVCVGLGAICFTLSRPRSIAHRKVLDRL